MIRKIIYQASGSDIQTNYHFYMWPYIKKKYVFYQNYFPPFTVRIYTSLHMKYDNFRHHAHSSLSAIANEFIFLYTYVYSLVWKEWRNENENDKRRETLLLLKNGDINEICELNCI